MQSNSRLVPIALAVALLGACDEGDQAVPAQPLAPQPQPTTTAPPPPASSVVYYPQIDPVHATNAYWAWRERFLFDCGNGQWRVQSHGEDTVSEAIGYGMLLTAIYEDPIAFHGLWRFYTDPNIVQPETGMMHWRVTGCPPQVTQTGPASDAELDVALALLIASCKWGGTYGVDAARLIQGIHEFETQPAGAITVLRPGTTWGGGGCTNPSYFSPGYYPSFGRGDALNAGFWTQFVSDTYAILEPATHPVTGLVPDWTDTQGNDGCPASGRDGGYGYDAARTPWRVGLDFIWWRSPAAYHWLMRISNWAASQGAVAIVDGYALDGAPSGSAHNSTFVGGFAVGAMAHSQALVDQFAGELVALDEIHYFEMTLRVLYLATLVGYFAPPAC